MTSTSISNKFSNKEFGDALKELKEQKGLSFMQIAIKCKLSDSYLVQLANKKNLAPKDENIEKIAKALGVEPSYFKEYRNRRLSETLGSSIDFHRDNYDVPLSDREVEILKKIIKKHTGDDL